MKVPAASCVGGGADHGPVNPGLSSHLQTPCVVYSVIPDARIMAWRFGFAPRDTCYPILPWLWPALQSRPYLDRNA